MRYLPEFGFLVAPTRRSLAYIDAMAQEGISPRSAVILEAATELSCDIARSLRDMGVDVVSVETADINASEIIQSISRSSWDIVLFSGPPGAIVRAALFGTGRKFLHIHPGALPDFRGSTTIYYSLLEQNDVTATAFYLDETIDTGPILLSRSFLPPPDRTKIDLEFDPFVRAEVLREILRKLADGHPLSAHAQRETDKGTHYIIHPVLKHIAILADNGPRKSNPTNKNP